MKFSRLVRILVILAFFFSISLVQAQALRRLPAPNNFRIISGSIVSWDAVPGADGYRLRWRPADGGGRVQVDGQFHTAYRIRGLKVGKSYRVWVAALTDAEGYRTLGSWSRTLTLVLRPTPTPTLTPTATNTPTATATPTPVTPQPLPAPRNLRLVSGSTVTWDAVPGAPRGYRLLLYLGGRAVRTTATRVTQYTFRNLEVGVIYEAVVVARGNGGRYLDSGPSNRLRLELEPTATPTATDTATSTSTPTATATNTPTATNTATDTATPTATATSTSTNTATATSTNTATATSTHTATATSTNTPTSTATATPTATVTATATPTATKKPKPKPTRTPRPSPTHRPPDPSNTPKSPTNTPEPVIYIHRAERKGYGNTSVAALNDARNRARNAVRRCADGDTQISSWIIDGQISEDIGGTRWSAKATVYIRCRVG